jgi:hypothetical protein
VPWWRKGLLIFLVATIHLGLIYSFNRSGSARLGTSYGSGAGLKALRLTVVPIAQSDKSAATVIANAATLPPPQTRRGPPISNPGNPALLDGYQNFRPETFLLAEDVDQTANPQETFSVALGQSLPLTFSAIEVEFWIDSTGKTVQVECIGENCTQDIAENLQQLLTLVFAPAVKNQMPVASRKRVLVEQGPTFGF